MLANSHRNSKPPMEPWTTCGDRARPSTLFLAEGKAIDAVNLDAPSHPRPALSPWNVKAIADGFEATHRVWVANPGSDLYADAIVSCGFRLRTARCSVPPGRDPSDVRLLDCINSFKSQSATLDLGHIVFLGTCPLCVSTLRDALMREIRVTIVARSDKLPGQLAALIGFGGLCDHLCLRRDFELA